MFGFLLKSAFRNAWRHPLRAILTITGLGVAILAFGLLKTVVTAWYAGADAASNARLVTRSSISLVFTLPISYKDRIRQVDGVESVSWANWFGGVYIDERYFFPQFAVSNGYLDQYPEFVISEAEKKAWLVDRKSADLSQGSGDPGRNRSPLDKNIPNGFLPAGYATRYIGSGIF